MKVSEIMTTDVMSVREDAEIEEAARLLARHRISGLPVFSREGRLVGLITELDLIAKPGKVVGDVMVRGVISVSSETSVEEVAHLLTNRKIRRVPVLDGDTLVGIVSRSDLIRQIAMRWVCHVCGEVVRNSGTAPTVCPACGSPESAFTSMMEMPGM
ncbi:MAG: CBS domain-containing protein [Roseiflexaceae bacterium]|nr:CBS domain-containing protein [Roseiflexaceae bacterium]